MRSQTINNSDLGITNGTISFPEEYCFAFNPNYVEIDLNNTSFSKTLSLVVQSGSLSNTIDVSTYQGKARCYVSRLLQLMFDDYFTTRCKEIEIHVHCGTTSIAAATVEAIWGGIQIGDLFSGPGESNLPFKDYRIPHRRDLKWFRKFPFTVSILRPGTTNYNVEGKNDNGAYSAIACSQKGIFELDPSSYFSSARYRADLQIQLSSTSTTFDKTFDFTFYSDGTDKYERVSLEICDDDTAGYYLRWVDRFGFIEYWLFVRGDRTNKLSYGSTQLDVEKEYEGLFFGDMIRYSEVKSEVSLKCSAVNLSRTQLFIVETICESSHVDLYLGKDKAGTELWLPVTIASGSYKTTRKQQLQDLEITINLPGSMVQRL